jgi:SAM-dependent methyltransferase
MSAPPPLFDRPTLDRRRARAARAPELFLQEHVALGCQERLEEVNRRFTAPAIVSPWPQVWADLVPGATVVPDAEVLDLQTGAHDLVIHALSLHWANDPVGQLVQCRHALSPDGMLLATLFGGQTLQELRRCLAQAETEVTGGLSPRVAPMGEIRDLGGLLQRAGLALPVADSETIPVSYESALHLMRDLRAMGETNVMTARLTRPTARAVFLRAAAIYAQSFGTDDGRITATFEVVTLTGWAPADSQPKPLRPGSAQARLADALNAAETPLDPAGD